MSERYEMEKLDDLANIPADRIETCLAELLPQLQKLSAARAMGVKVTMPKATWIDDGLTKVTLNFHITHNEN
jgi:hypothetical protein